MPAKKKPAAKPAVSKTSAKKTAAQRPLSIDEIVRTAIQSVQNASAKTPTKTPTKPSPQKTAPAPKHPRAPRAAAATAAPRIPDAPSIPASSLPPHIAAIVTALDDKKAEHLRILDVRGKSSITDYLIIVTATSEPHLRALRIAAEKALLETGARSIGSEAKSGSGWYVVDAFDAIVHIFLQQQRDAYKIEELWAVRGA